MKCFFRPENAPFIYIESLRLCVRYSNIYVHLVLFVPRGKIDHTTMDADGQHRSGLKERCNKQLVSCYNMRWALTNLSENGKIWKIILEFAHFKQNCVIHKTRVNTVRSTYCRPLCCLQCLSFCSKKETIPSRTIFLCPWHKKDETFHLVKLFQN